MEDRIKKIVDSLITGTTTGKLQWHGTERDDEYILKLSKGAITVDSWEGYDEESGDSSNLVDIAFLNALGEVVERIIFPSYVAYPDYARMMELHRLAKRNSLKIDETLDDFLEEIEKKIL